MSLLSFKLYAALTVLAVTLIAGFYPFKVRLAEAVREFPIGEALAAGVFLGAGLIHMLADANHTFTSLGYHYPVAYLLAGGTFLFFLWLEHLGMALHHRQRAMTVIVMLAVVMLSFHSLLAGTALGMSSSYGDAVIVLIAILAHKWAASFSLAVQLNKSSMSTANRLITFIIFAVMTPLGIFIGGSILGHVSEKSVLEPVFNALAAGTFLYIGTLHGLEHSVMVKRCCNIKEFSWVIVGFALMAIVAIWV